MPAELPSTEQIFTETSRLVPLLKGKYQENLARWKQKLVRDQSDFLVRLMRAVKTLPFCLKVGVLSQMHHR